MGENADKLIIGPAIAFTFRVATGNKIGDSLVELDKVDLAKELIEEFGDKLYFAEDSLCADGFKDVEGKYMEEIEDGYMGLDIGHKTISKIEEILSDAKTVI
jgi:phosphoglycerate kinase